MAPRKKESVSEDTGPAIALRFAEIRGHGQAIDFLRRAFAGKRLAHAYFFGGPTGVGKLAVARALAMGLHCETTPFEACGACQACRTIAAGTHPDVRVIAGPAKDRRDVSIEQVRTLQRDLGFRSLSGRPKVGIVNDAHLLTTQAQNALLKTLEEPSGDSLLVLIAVNAATLEPTILSRCQRVRFSPLAREDVAAILGARGRTPAEAAALAAYAAGSPGQALDLDREFFITRRPELLRRLASLRGQGFAKVSAFAQELASDEGDLTAALGVIASWYRDGLRRRLLGADEPLQNVDLADALPAADAVTSLRNLETTYATILALRQNANRNLALTQLLLQIAR
jgi:DNA polymerase-3 subunit delta'